MAEHSYGTQHKFGVGAQYYIRACRKIRRARNARHVTRGGKGEGSKGLGLELPCIPDVLSLCWNVKEPQKDWNTSWSMEGVWSNRPGKLYEHQ